MDSFLVTFTANAHKLQAARCLAAKKVEVETNVECACSANSIRVLGRRLTGNRLIQMIRESVDGGKFITFVIRKEVQCK